MFVLLKGVRVIFSLSMELILKANEKNLCASQIQHTNATDHAFMNITYNNVDLILPKFVRDIIQIIAIGMWKQKLVHNLLNTFEI